MAKFKFQTIVILLFRRKLIEEKTQNELLEAFDYLCRRITSFKQTLKID